MRPVSLQVSGSSVEPPATAGLVDAALWDVVVAGPEPEVSILDWSDSNYGDSDGVLDNGERQVITVNLKNFGAGLSDRVDAVLRTASSNVTIYDSTSTWTNLN